MPVITHLHTAGRKKAIFAGFGVSVSVQHLNRIISHIVCLWVCLRKKALSLTEKCCQRLPDSGKILLIVLLSRLRHRSGTAFLFIHHHRRIRASQTDYYIFRCADAVPQLFCRHTHKEYFKYFPPDN